MVQTERIEELRKATSRDTGWGTVERRMLIDIIFEHIHGIQDRHTARFMFRGADTARIRGKALCLQKDEELKRHFRQEFIKLIEMYLKTSDHERLTSLLIEDGFISNRIHDPRTTTVAIVERVDRMHIAGQRGVCRFILKDAHQKFFYAEVLHLSRHFLSWSEQLGFN